MIPKPGCLVKGDSERGWKTKKDEMYLRRVGRRAIIGRFLNEGFIIANRFIVAERPSRLVALAEALVVNIIWATTFILIKIGLGNLGPLTLGGLRYFGGFLLLLPLMAHSSVL
jgi:hypothetical protein